MYKTLSALLLGLLLVAGGVHAQQTVTLTASTSPPYADAKLPEQGLAMELVNHVFKRAGYQPQIEFKIWSRAMEGVSVGLYDALAAAWYSEEREKEYLFSDAYLTSKLILLKLRTDPTVYADKSHLAGKRLGTQVDYAYGIDFDAISGLSLVPENHAIQNLLGLLNGRVDVVIGDQRTLAMQLNEYLPKEMHKFEVVEANLPPRARHVAASRAIEGEEKLVADFNRALKAVRKDGSYDAIVAKWDKRYPLK
ncbi:MAG: transporter substrate-binding domain-containing protein [Proteobacteria bacterium]|nr:transporter substrate-binding domain-containing protein [Pseudomonadota bacterium]